MLSNTSKLREYSSETSLKDSDLKESDLKESSFLKEKSFSQNSWNIQISKEDKEDKDQTMKIYLNLIKRILLNN